jgi:hypothetical protein
MDALSLIITHKRKTLIVSASQWKYPFELTTRTADMLLSKIMWNSIISTLDAQFAGANIKNMYLKNLLDWYEYMRMPLDLFPDNIVNHYNLRRKAKNVFV